MSAATTTAAVTDTRSKLTEHIKAIFYLYSYHIQFKMLLITILEWVVVAITVVLYK